MVCACTPTNARCIYCTLFGVSLVPGAGIEAAVAERRAVREKMLARPPKVRCSPELAISHACSLPPRTRQPARLGGLASSVAEPCNPEPRRCSAPGPPRTPPCCAWPRRRPPWRTWCACHLAPPTAPARTRRRRRCLRGRRRTAARCTGRGARSGASPGLTGGQAAWYLRVCLLWLASAVHVDPLDPPPPALHTAFPSALQASGASEAASSSSEELGGGWLHYSPPPQQARSCIRGACAYPLAQAGMHQA